MEEKGQANNGIDESQNPLNLLNDKSGGLVETFMTEQYLN